MNFSKSESYFYQQSLNGWVTSIIHKSMSDGYFWNGRERFRHRIATGLKKRQEILTYLNFFGRFRTIHIPPPPSWLIKLQARNSNTFHFSVFSRQISNWFRIKAYFFEWKKDRELLICLNFLSTKFELESNWNYLKQYIFWSITTPKTHLPPRLQHQTPNHPQLVNEKAGDNFWHLPNSKLFLDAIRIWFRIKL